MDRPDREKIAKWLFKDNLHPTSKIDWANKWDRLSDRDKQYWLDKADKLLALFALPKLDRPGNTDKVEDVIKILTRERRQSITQNIYIDKLERDAKEICQLFLPDIEQLDVVEARRAAKEQERDRIFRDIDNAGLIGEHTDNPSHEIGATLLDCPACCWYAYKAQRSKE